MATENEKRKIWGKGKFIREKDPNLYRKDYLGNIIYWHSYGLDTDMGWEIDHINPKDKGGSESIRNKQPLQTKANREKSNRYPYRKKR